MKYSSQIPIKTCYNLAKGLEYSRNEIQKANGFFNSCTTKLSHMITNLDNVDTSSSRMPEVLFLGASNVGKSSLISSVMGAAQSKGKTQSTDGKKEFARVSSKAGHTRFLNFYTCGAKLRIVDSPGYGKASHTTQGSLIHTYLENQQRLRNAYVLINPTKGIQENDLGVFEILAHYGVPFQVVLTQCDRYFKSYKVQAASSPKSSKVKMIRDVDAERLNMVSSTLYEDVLKMASRPHHKGGNPMLVQELFVTSTETFFGIPELRAAVLRSCGLN